MNGGFTFTGTTGWASNAVPIVIVVGRIVEVLRVATLNGGGPRWFGAGGLFCVGFFTVDGAGFACLLTTGVLVLVGWAVGTSAIAGTVFAQITAVANGRTFERGCQTWVASLALGRIVSFSSKPHWAIVARRLAIFILKFTGKTRQT